MNIYQALLIFVKIIPAAAPLTYKMSYYSCISGVSLLEFAHFD